MKYLWKFRIELCIFIMGILLIANIFIPNLGSQGIYTCMLFVFSISIVLLKLSNYSNHMQNKVNRGGRNVYDFKSRKY